AGVSPAGAGRRSSAAVRIVAEVARLRRTTKVLIGLLALAVTGFGWSQWTALRDARELAGLQARADSLNQEAQRLLSRFQSELQSVKDALRESHAEVARLRGELAAASSGGDVHSVARLRARLRPRGEQPAARRPRCDHGVSAWGGPADGTARPECCGGGPHAHRGHGEQGAAERRAGGRLRCAGLVGEPDLRS